MTPYQYLSERLESEMVEGQMHVTLRDVGRMAGGLVAGSNLSRRDMRSLEELAISLARNKEEAAEKWRAAVTHGKQEPLRWSSLRPPKEDCAIDWNDEIKEDLQIIDRDWVERIEVPEPAADTWDPVAEITEYLSTLFAPEEYVGYVTESNVEQKPRGGCYSRTAGQLLDELERYKAIVPVFGDMEPAVGAWIRFNPLDGKGIKDANVTDYRYALVESDKGTSIEDQRGFYEKLELPIVLMVHSGNKSLHAIVRIEADSLPEFKRRVNLLYKVCEKNGLLIDRANSNPSRLSRMPGVMRGEKKQFIVARACGKPSWSAWEEWVEAVNDDLPEAEQLADVWDNLPPLAPPLIEGMLRQGHKMLISGPSKAGKSYQLIQLCIAIAEGLEWLGLPCAQGRVLYVNLELDRASCLHRFKDVYTALDWPPKNIANIDIWNLRGQAVPMDRLAPKLIRRAAKKKYCAIVIDPIYKVLTGNENEADKMAYFCNQFDRLCYELHAAVIYCHHHSKGAQGQKRSMDRASGSGVFARDPDALLDVIELEVPTSLRKKHENAAVCNLVVAELTRRLPSWDKEVAAEDLKEEEKLRGHAARLLGDVYEREIAPLIIEERDRIKRMTAWRIDGTYREFPYTDPTDVWFSHPCHALDTADELTNLEAAVEVPAWKRGVAKAKKQAAGQAPERLANLQKTYKLLSSLGPVTVLDASRDLGIRDRTVREHAKEFGWKVDGGILTPPREQAERLDAEARADEEAFFEGEEGEVF